LTSLRQTAVFAAAPRSLNDLPSQVGRNDHSLRQTDAVNVPSAAGAAREGRRDPPILPPRVSPPKSAAALGPVCPAVPEAASRPFGQPKPRQIARHLNFELNGLRHTRLMSLPGNVTDGSPRFQAPRWSSAQTAVRPLFLPYERANQRSLDP
jgi:hypothetical protein